MNKKLKKKINEAFDKIEKEVYEKEEITNFEESIIRLLRLKGIKEMNYPGGLTIHFSKDRKTNIVRPVSAERREIMA